MEVYCWNMRDLKKDFKNLENLKIKNLAKLMFILLLKQYTPLLSPLPPSKKKKNLLLYFPVYIAIDVLFFRSCR